jgi:hypothetical protein
MDWAFGGEAWPKQKRGNTSATRLAAHKCPIDNRYTPWRGYAERITERFMVRAYSLRSTLGWGASPFEIGYNSSARTSSGNRFLRRPVYNCTVDETGSKLYEKFGITLDLANTLADEH